MLAVLLSSASRKAWAAAIVSAGLTPFIDLLTGDGEITARTALVALVTGIINGAAVFGTTNEPPGAITEDDVPGEHAADR